MSKIENLIDILKKESYQFHERIETNINRLSLLNKLVPLLLIFQLFTYSLHQTIIHFDHMILNTVISEITEKGLVILQAQGYSAIFHLMFSTASAFMVLLFAIQILINRVEVRWRWLKDAMDGLMMLCAGIVCVSPGYFLITPYHLIYLMTGMAEEPYSKVLMALLPCYLLFFCSCIFLQHNRSIVTPFHLLIPICDYLGYDDISLNVMIMVCAILSYLQVIHGHWIHRMLNTILILINLWAILEKTIGCFSVCEEVLALLIMCWVFASFFVSIRKEENEQQQINRLEYLIKSLEKPETQKKQHYVECLYLEHFLNCNAKEGSFCANYAATKPKKLLLQMPKESLMGMLEQKIETDFETTHKQELEIRLTEFRFSSKVKHLKLYKEAYEKSGKSESKSFSQAYEHYKMMSKFQRRLEKQSASNLIIFKRIDRAAAEDQIFNDILKQLHRLRSLWSCCLTNDPNRLQTSLRSIISFNQTIEHRFHTLSQQNFINPKKLLLYDLYCTVFSRARISNSHTTIQLANQQQLPHYLTCSGQTIERVSRAFQMTYHYNQEELKKQHVNVLLPRVMHPMHDEMIKEWSGGEITDKKSKWMVNGKGFIDGFGFMMLIYPEFEEGLRYVAYLEPSPHDNRLFLYNIKDDHFEKLSEELIKELTSSGFTCDTIIELRCQDIFSGIDLKNSTSRQRLKNPLPCTFSKQRSSVINLSLKLLKDYQFGGGHYALLSVSKDEQLPDNSGYLNKSTRQQQSRITSDKLKLQERVNQIKEEIRQDSKLVWKIFTINILFIVIITAYFIYEFVETNNRLTQFHHIEHQTKLKLQIRLLFSEIVLRNAQLYTITIPSKISPIIYKDLIASWKSIISDRVDRINMGILQRLADPSHYKILHLIEQITDDRQRGNINTVSSNVPLIQQLLRPPQSSVNVENNTVVGTVIVSLALVVFLAVNLMLTARIQAPIPRLKGMFMAMKSGVATQRIKEVELVMSKFEVIEGDGGRNQMDLKIQNQQGGKSNPFCSNILCKVLALNVLIVIICASCIGIIIGLSIIQQKSRQQSILIDKFQTYFFKRSVQMVRLVLFTHLHFADMYNNKTTPNSSNHLLFLQQIKNINTKDSKAELELMQLNTIFLDISNTAWANINRDICPQLYPAPSPLQSSCRSIVNSTLTYGQYKSIVRLQLLLIKLNQLPNVTSRYDNDNLIHSVYLSQMLAQYNRLMYLNYTDRVNSYYEESEASNLLSFLVMMMVIVVYVVAVGCDRVKKNARVNILKELFVLIPCEEFEVKETDEEDILEVIKNI